ncbi:MAG: hypothetical protein PHX74_04730 [Candidatus Sumerlaeales bacterium]|nr:hypothetical protein [Candidatus Sumerlaeales bacterium]
MTRTITTLLICGIAIAQVCAQPVTTSTQPDDNVTTDRLRSIRTSRPANAGPQIDTKQPVPIPTMLPANTNIKQTTATTVMSYQYLTTLITNSVSLQTSESEKLIRLERKYNPDINGRPALEAAMFEFKDALPQEKQIKLHRVLSKLPVPIDIFKQDSPYADAPYDTLPEKLAAPLSLSASQIKYCDNLLRRYNPKRNGASAYQRAMREFKRGINATQKLKLEDTLTSISDKFPPLEPTPIPAKK